MGTHNCGTAEELRQEDSKFKTCLGQSNSTTSTSTNKAGGTASKEKSQMHGYSSSNQHTPGENQTHGSKGQAEKMRKHEARGLS